MKIPFLLGLLFYPNYVWPLFEFDRFSFSKQYYASNSDLTFLLSASRTILQSILFSSIKQELFPSIFPSILQCTKYSRLLVLCQCLDSFQCDSYKTKAHLNTLKLMSDLWVVRFPSKIHCIETEEPTISIAVCFECLFSRK